MQKCINKLRNKDHFQFKNLALHSICFECLLHRSIIIIDWREFHFSKNMTGSKLLFFVNFDNFVGKKINICQSPYVEALCKGGGKVLVRTWINHLWREAREKRQLMLMLMLYHDLSTLIYFRNKRKAWYGNIKAKSRLHAVILKPLYTFAA